MVVGAKQFRSNWISACALRSKVRRRESYNKRRDNPIREWREFKRKLYPESVESSKPELRKRKHIREQDAGTVNAATCEHATYTASICEGEAGACAKRLRQDGAQARGRRHHQSHQDEHQRTVGGRAPWQSWTFSFHARRVCGQRDRRG